MLVAATGAVVFASGSTVAVLGLGSFTIGVVADRPRRGGIDDENILGGAAMLLVAVELSILSLAPLPSLVSWGLFAMCDGLTAQTALGGTRRPAPAWPAEASNGCGPTPPDRLRPTGVFARFRAIRRGGRVA